MPRHGRQIVFKTRVARQSTLESRRNQLGMRIDIIDDGPGIPDESAGRFFIRWCLDVKEGVDWAWRWRKR